MLELTAATEPPVLAANNPDGKLCRIRASDSGWSQCRRAITNPCVCGNQRGVLIPNFAAADIAGPRDVPRSSDSGAGKILFSTQSENGAKVVYQKIGFRFDVPKYA